MSEGRRGMCGYRFLLRDMDGGGKGGERVVKSWDGRGCQLVTVLERLDSLWSMKYVRVLSE